MGSTKLSRGDSLILQEGTEISLPFVEETLQLCASPLALFSFDWFPCRSTCCEGYRIAFIAAGGGTAVRYVLRWAPEEAGSALSDSFVAGMPAEDLRRLELNFSLECQIGQGAHATVWKARHRKSGNLVAIKAIDKRQWVLKTGRDESALRTEVEILQRCRHANIVRLWKEIDTPRMLHLVLEFLDGGSLMDKIAERGAFPEIFARGIFEQVATAVQYLHDEMDCSHRDLKPENILMRRHVERGGKRCVFEEFALYSRRGVKEDRPELLLLRLLPNSTGTK